MTLTGKYSMLRWVWNWIFTRYRTFLIGLPEDTTTVIYSEFSVKTARERRERLRKTDQLPGDFVSLSVTRPEDIDQGPHPDSRLVREEDELGEGDDGLCPLLSDVLWSLLC